MSLIDNSLKALIAMLVVIAAGVAGAAPNPALLGSAAVPPASGDTTAPQLTSAVLTGTNLVLGFSEAVTRGAGYNDADWNIDNSTAEEFNIALTYVSGDGTTNFTYTTATLIDLGIDEADVDFNGDANSMEDAAGNDLAAVTSYTVASGGGGDIEWNELTQGANTSSDPVTTAAMTPTAGAQVFVAFAVAVEGGGNTTDADSVTVTDTIGIDTWTLVRRAHISASGDRRSVYVYRGVSPGSPANGTITIDFTAATGTWTETMWSIDEALNVDVTTPTSNTATNGATSGTAGSVTVGAAPDAGDHVYAAWVVTGASASVTLGSELETALTNLGGGSDVRTILAAYDSTPDASPVPNITWTGSEGWAGVAFIVEKAP